MTTQAQTCVYCKKPIPFEHRCRTVSCDFCSKALLQFMKVVASDRYETPVIVQEAKELLLAYLGSI